jgi:phosphoglycolate phosphatase
MPATLPALIFDLDGTLTDSKPGILGCLKKVLDKRGIEAHGPLDRFIGPPVEDWVVDLLPNGTKEDHITLASEYRGCYDREGWSNNSVFVGVKKMLLELRERGVPLYVCTSKQQHFAVRILNAFELLAFFTAVYGDKTEYASHDKADLLGNLMREQGLDRENAWMIGDRSFDIDAAHANGVRCLAAGWGYGSAEEHAGAKADAIAATPADVASLVLPVAEVER